MVLDFKNDLDFATQNGISISKIGTLTYVFAMDFYTKKSIAYRFYGFTFNLVNLAQTDFDPKNPLFQEKRDC